MSIPFFYAEQLGSPGSAIELDEDNSRHVVQVLRMEKGEALKLTDGRGHLVMANIVEANKKHCRVGITKSEFVPQPAPQLCIAISLIKNTSRFEWFIEKAAELGTAEIVPLVCERTEKLKVRHDRLAGISKSAMLQSEQAWLTNVHEPTKFKDMVENAVQLQKIIAHCTADQEQPIASVFDRSKQSHIVLIGPEGDFSPAEVELAKEKGFTGVSLGSTRLRTETAGIFAAIVCR